MAYAEDRFSGSLYDPRLGAGSGYFDGSAYRDIDVATVSVDHQALPDDIPVAGEVEIDIEEDASPEQIFARHVAYVREHGDALDVELSNKPSINGWAGSLSSIALGSEGFRLIASEAPAAAMATLLATWVALARTGAVYAEGDKQTEAHAEHTKAMSPETVEAVGEQYELYRVSRGDGDSVQHEIVMRWYGPAKTEGDKPLPSRSESLRNIADLASENNIRAVLMDTDVADEGVSAAMNPKKIDVAEWLRTRKSKEVVFSKDDNLKRPVNYQLAAFSPEELQLLARGNGKQRVIEERFEPILELLDNVAPEHPLLATFQEYRSDPDELVRQLRRTSTMAMERSMDDVMVAAAEDRISQPGQKQRVSLQGRVANQSVNMISNGLTYETRELASAAGVSSDTIADMLEHPEFYDEREIIRAVEYSVYQIATGEGYALYAASDVEPGEPYVGPLLQNVLFDADKSRNVHTLQLAENQDPMFIATDRYRSNSRAAARLTLKCAAVGIAAMAPWALQNGADDLRSWVYERADKAAAAELDVAPEDLPAEIAEEARSQELADWPGIQAVLAIDEFIDTGAENDNEEALHVFPFLRPPDEKAETTNPGAKDMMAIGNVENPTEEVLWDVQAQGDMSTSGYWAMRTGYEFVDNKRWHNPDDWVGWNSVQDLQVLHTELHPDHLSLRVTREVSPNEFGLAEQSAGIWQNAIRIPVLDGMAPVAANLEGEQIDRANHRDGTFSLMLRQEQVDELLASDSDEDLTLTYWVQPEQGQTGARLTQANTIVYSDAPDLVVDRSGIAAVWEEYANTGIYPRGSVFALKENLQANYLSENLDYAFEPLPEDMSAEGATYPARLTELVLKLRQANCNIAGTALALDNPQLNIAVGFRDDGDGKLRNQEAHMWTVDSSGYDIDPTPADIDSYQQEQAGDKSQLSMWVALGLAGLAGGLGVSMAAHPQTRRESAELWRRQLKRRVDALPVDKLNRVKRTAETAAYAPRFDSRAVSMQPGEHPDRAALMTTLTDPSMHSGAVGDSIEQALESTDDPAAKHLLKEAQRTLRLIDRAGLVNEHLPPARIEDVL